MTETTKLAYEVRHGTGEADGRGGTVWFMGTEEIAARAWAARRQREGWEQVSLIQHEDAGNRGLINPVDLTDTLDG
jgi:hypothetical protein